MTNQRSDKAAVVDMSPAAVARRLDTVQSLYELMMSIRGARVVGKVKDREVSAPRTSESDR
jgi:hypothetical protein